MCIRRSGPVRSECGVRKNDRKIMQNTVSAEWCKRQMYVCSATCRFGASVPIDVVDAPKRDGVADRGKLNAN